MSIKAIEDYLVFEYEVTIHALDLTEFSFDVKLNDDIGEVIISHCGFDTLRDAKIDALNQIILLMKGYTPYD